MRRPLSRVLWSSMLIMAAIGAGCSALRPNEHGDVPVAATSPAPLQAEVELAHLEHRKVTLATSFLLELTVYPAIFALWKGRRMG